MYTTATKPSDQPIDIDASSRVLEIFLDLASVATPFCPPPPIIADEVHSVLKLCRQLDCPDLVTQARIQTETLASGDPWTVLMTAFEYEDVAFARIGINQMRLKDLKCLTSGTECSTSDGNGRRPSSITSSRASRKIGSAQPILV